MPNFTVGEKFLSSSEEVRLSQVKEWGLLFDNAYEALTKMVVSQAQLQKESSEWWLQIGAALPGLISKVSADLLFGEAPIITSKDESNQEFIETYFNDVFLQELYQGALTQSSEGGVVIKVFTEEEQALAEAKTPSKIVPRIQLLPEKGYFPTFERFTNIRTAVDLVTIEPRDKRTFWVLREHHEVGFVTFEEYILDKSSGEIKEAVKGSFKAQRTGLEIIPIFYLPNFKKLGDTWGRSDYAGVEPAFVALNRRLTQNDHNLLMHGGGKLQGPGASKGILDQFGRPSKATVLDYLTIPQSQVGGKFIEYKYVQPQLSVTEDLETVNLLLKFIFLLTDISPDVFGLGEGQADSGKALKLRLLRTLTMVRRKAGLWKIALKWTIDLALFILGVSPNYTLVMQDGLPADIEAIIEEMEGGLLSQKDGLKKAHGYDDETADTKLAEIRTDNIARSEARNAGLSL